MPEITIATSITPRNIELQRAAIDSWLNLGFKVISLNSAEEAAIVRQKFPDIPVEIATRTAETITGKPYVFFDDILKIAVENCSGKVFGIINADILLDAGPDFPAFIAEQARGGVVFGCRTEIATPDEREGEMYSEGFDFFFMDPAIISLYPPADFCLGAPWWDYWAPLVPLLHRVPVKWLVTPVAYHVKHPIFWSNDRHLDFGQELIRHLQAPSLSDLIGDKLRGQIEAAPSHPDFYPFSLDVCRLIREQAEHIFYPGSPNLKSMAIVGESHYGRLVSRCHKLEDSRATLEDRLQACLSAQEATDLVCQENALLIGKMKSSIIWRLTAPLRFVTDKLLSRK